MVPYGIYYKGILIYPVLSFKSYLSFLTIFYILQKMNYIRVIVYKFKKFVNEKAAIPEIKEIFLLI
jgi:hypothetical protein